MKVLVVSYYAEAHLPSSAAQNTRLLAESLVGEGHEVRVVCGAAAPGSEDVAGYRLIKLPLASASWTSRWLGAWRPDPRVRELARRELAAWRPDVLWVGAWKLLTEFALEARRRDIPVVQLVHDYSLICLRQWLLDSSGSLCSGPTSEAKCLRCVEHSLGARARLASRLLSLPLAPAFAGALLGPDHVADRHVPTAVGEALTHMAAYRRAVTLFVAQAPSVVEVLSSAAIAPSRCRFLPQFIGEDKLARYPRPQEPPGAGRPLRLAYVGRWSSEKGPDILLDALRAAEVPLDVELWIISRNADPATLEATTKTGSGCSKRIRVINGAGGAEVSRLLAQCDLCVIPSRCRELASRVVLEANAQGVPAIASSTVGNSYLIRDLANGRIFPSGSVEALRGCIEEVAAEPGLIRQWSDRVAEPVGREEWTTLALEILEEAIRSRPSSP